MNTFAKTILVSSILSLGLTTAMVAQPGTSQYDQWYRAKYGRPGAHRAGQRNAASRPRPRLKRRNRPSR